MTLWLVYRTPRKSNTCTRWWEGDTSGALNGLSQNFTTTSTQIKCTPYRTFPQQVYNKVDNTQNSATKVHNKVDNIQNFATRSLNKVDNIQNFAPRSSQ
jgi:hypothetical protein